MPSNQFGVEAKGNKRAREAFPNILACLCLWDSYVSLKVLEEVPTNLAEIKSPTVQVDGHLEELVCFRDT